jgi:broad specificity phosphatase PhoE
MRVILVRHYQTLSNAAGRILGWADSPPCVDWRADVDFIASQLRKGDVGIDAVYASDLTRARQTAISYAESFGVADVIAVPELREINYGKLQTREKTTAFSQYPEHKKDPDLVYPDGESFRQMQRRSVPFVTSLATAYPNSTILVVSHAGVIRGLVSYFLKLEYALNLRRKISFRYIGDFVFEGKDRVHYNELGQPSGFVCDGGISVPLQVTTIAS